MQTVSLKGRGLCSFHAAGDVQGGSSVMGSCWCRGAWRDLRDRGVLTIADAAVGDDRDDRVEGHVGDELGEHEGDEAAHVARGD